MEGEKDSSQIQRVTLQPSWSPIHLNGLVRERHSSLGTPREPPSFPDPSGPHDSLTHYAFSCQLTCSFTCLPPHLLIPSCTESLVHPLIPRTVYLYICWLTHLFSSSAICDQVLCWEPTWVGLTSSTPGVQGLQAQVRL